MIYTGSDKESIALRQYPSLSDWRRRVTELYAAVRAADDPHLAWAHFVDGRNQLFKEHSQTPLSGPDRRNFSGLDYFKYDLDLRLNGRLKFDVEPRIFNVHLQDDDLLRFQRVASVHFRLGDRPQQLSLFWILGYGGGLFLPFKDKMSGSETFGGGRYLYDTIKGADLGVAYDTVVLDFNFAYNPSCAYHAKWTCPLAPQENHLPVAVRAGEKNFTKQANQ